MCTGGSDSNPLKNPLYWMVKQDSRGASQLGRTLGWDWLTQEGKTNQDNPGRAITKAAEVAATMYGAGLLGGAEAGAGGVAADGLAGAASDAGLLTAADASAGGVSAAGTGLASQAAPVAASMLPEGAANSLGAGPLTNAAYSTMVPGVGSQQAAMLAAQTGDFGAPGLGLTMQAASGAQGLNPASAYLSNLVGRGLTGGASAASSAKKAQLALKGYQMMQPHPPPMQQARPMMGGGGQQAPLPNPYGSPAGNSLGLSSLTEAQKQQLRAMGIQI